MKEQRHSILLPTLTTVILLSCAITVGSQPIITSNLRAVDKKHVASPMEKVILTCKTSQSTTLAWSITPPLFDKSLIRYTPSDDPRSKNFTVGGFQSFLSEKIEIDQTHANLTSILTFVAREQYFNRTAITCADGKSNVTAMLFLSASNQAKIIYDFQYEGYIIARLNQSVSLECSIADTLHLDWIIEPFITSSNPIGFLLSNDVGMIVTQNHFTGTLTSLTPSLSDAQRANMTSTLSFVANSSFDGSLHVIECHSDTSGVATILQIVEFSPRLTNFTCSMGTIVCGPPSTATVQCTWEVPAGGSRPLFFTIRLPNGTEDLIAGTQNSYSFVLSCEGGGPQEVYIFSNFNNDGAIQMISASECRDVCMTGLSLSLAPVAAVVILPTALIVLLVIIITVLLMPQHFKVINEELVASKGMYPLARQPNLEENTELHDMCTDSELLYHISWTVWWKSADQLVTVHQHGSDSKTTETTTRCQYYDRSCQPGSQYKVSVRTESACCVPFKRREKFFLTEVKLVSYPSGNVVTELNHFAPEDEGLVTCRYECGQDQRIKETYKRVQTNTQATVYERVVSNISSTGTERLITIPFTRRIESRKYQIVLETLPIMGSTGVLNHPKVEVVFSVTVKVLPRIPQNLDYTDCRLHSVKLCWEQEYRNEDEEPSEYHVTVAEEAELCGPIVPTVSKIYPAKYMYTCEYTLRGLEPSKSYTVGITVNNMDGAVHSDEVTIVTTLPTDSSLDVTVPEKMVTSVSAEIQWMIHIHPNLFADSHAKLVVNPEAQMTVTNTQYMKELDSINGSFEFPNLQPSTSYCASLIITYPGVKDPVTKKMDPFKTKGAPVKPPPPKCVHITVDEAILEFDTSLVLVHEKCFCSLYNATKKVEVCREEVKKDRVKVFVSPKTKYEARLIVCISKFPNYITKSDPEVFDVPDYEPHVDLDFSDGIATLTVDPPLPKSAMVVIKANSGVWGSYVTVKKVKATEKNVFDMTNPKYPEAMHIVQLVLGKREEYTPCGTFTTPKAKGAGHGGGDLDSIYK